MWNKHNTQFAWIQFKALLIYHGISKTTSGKSFHQILSNVTFMVCNIHVDCRQNICLNLIQGHFEVKSGTESQGAMLRYKVTVPSKAPQERRNN